MFLSAIVFAAIGCGPALPKVYPVNGKVINKGKGHIKDLKGYNVQLQSTTDPKEMPGGSIEEDGAFTLYTRVGGKTIAGAKEGTYRICILPPARDGPSPPLVIPVHYTKFETSKLERTITPGSNDITIEIDRGR
jgi:hypothetical protein